MEQDNEKSGWGKAWRITPRRRQQYLWLWACSKAGEKLVPFIFKAIHDRCKEVLRSRIASGKKVEQWVIEEMAEPAVPALPAYIDGQWVLPELPPFQDVKNDTVSRR